MNQSTCMFKDFLMSLGHFCSLFSLLSFFICSTSPTSVPLNAILILIRFHSIISPSRAFRLMRRDSRLCRPFLRNQPSRARVPLCPLVPLTATRSTGQDSKRLSARTRPRSTGLSTSVSGRLLAPWSLWVEFSESLFKIVLFVNEERCMWVVCRQNVMISA